MLQFGLSASYSLGGFGANFQGAKYQTSFSEVYNVAMGVLATCVQTIIIAFDNCFLHSLLEKQ